MLFERTRNSLKRSSQKETDGLNYDIYKMKATTLSFLDAMLTNTEQTLYLEADDLNNFFEIINSDEITSKYTVEQTKKDANLFMFKLKKQDFSLV